MSNMPSKRNTDRRDQGKPSALERGQHVLDVPYRSTPTVLSVPHPRLANQGSHTHGTRTSPPEELHYHEAIRTFGRKRNLPDSPWPSSSDRLAARSSSQVSGVTQGSELDYPGFLSVAGGRRNAICSEAIKEYLATHPPSEAWGTDDENNDSDMLTRPSLPTTAGQRTGTAGMQRSLSSTAERGPARSRPIATNRVLQSTANASAEDDETTQIRAFWNDQNARGRGRYG